ncbi:AMP-binding protein [Kibdelosporangium phytohabitans]|uniref:Acyl-CoA synthetase n=1 Tax=Kibdelosporangium phytohabitans TaxID=860235 RepID=A0A0N9HYL8_9PSEU|nr:AMP-binding protein [Kibdelosporangium phytohabitans]ALG08806.1 acyl-CoA synthetase [Kibdelosporangium phytohabitans]MBE1470054.1 crotonobetaine/carnitine-CoA ligase [Kibdelosporangium phytohabitans]
MDDLVGAIAEAARKWPSRVAWTFDPGERLTFAQVHERSSGYAQALRDKGIGQGDRVAVLLRNQAEFPLIWFALVKLGAVIVPVNVKYRSVDASHLLRSSEAVAVVTTREFGPLLDAIDAPPVHHIDTLSPQPGFEQGPVNRVVNIQYTSGTTGSPKGCVLSHEYWLRLAGSLVEHFPNLTEHDVMLTAQPFHYIDPQWNVVAALLAGAHLVVLDGFHPSSFWAKVREHRVTYFYCLGAMPALLLKMPPDPADRDHRVRAVQASAIPLPLHQALEQRWGVGWYEAFGMTETGADIRITAEDHDAFVGTGCLGRPAPHREARIADGELLLRGPGMMDGYLGRPDVFDDGWFHTGDLARIDENGRVYHLGRIKDMIRRSGENIAAHEVEEVLMSHPGVRLAAVVGVPDDIRGEEVKAFVVGDAGEDELAAYCADRLAAFKIPRFWELRAELPLTASERVAKERLR